MNIKDKLKKINPKHKALAALLLPVLAIGAFIYLVFIPYNAKITTLQENINQAESDIAKGKVMERKLEDLKVANAKLQGELGDITTFLPGPQEDAQLQDIMKAMASEAGMTVVSWTPGAMQQGPGGLYGQTEVMVELSGGFHEFGRFVQMIDAMQRMISIKSISMSEAKLQGTKMSIPVKMTIVAFTAVGGK